MPKWSKSRGFRVVSVVVLILLAIGAAIARKVLFSEGILYGESAAKMASLAVYYSRCFPVCDHAAAPRGSRLGCGGYMLSPPSGRRGSGGEGCQAGAVVVPAGAGLVA